LRAILEHVAQLGYKALAVVITRCLSLQIKVLEGEDPVPEDSPFVFLYNLSL